MMHPIQTYFGDEDEQELRDVDLRAVLFADDQDAPLAPTTTNRNSVCTDLKKFYVEKARPKIVKIYNQELKLDLSCENIFSSRALKLVLFLPYLAYAMLVTLLYGEYASMGAPKKSAWTELDAMLLTLTSYAMNFPGVLLFGGKVIDSICRIITTVKKALVEYKSDLSKIAEKESFFSYTFASELFTRLNEVSYSIAAIPAIILVIATAIPGAKIAWDSSHGVDLDWWLTKPLSCLWPVNFPTAVKRVAPYVRGGLTGVAWLNTIITRYIGSIGLLSWLASFVISIVQWSLPLKPERKTVKDEHDVIANFLYDLKRHPIKGIVSSSDLEAMPDREVLRDALASKGDTESKKDYKDIVQKRYEDKLNKRLIRLIPVYYKALHAKGISPITTQERKDRQILRWVFCRTFALATFSLILFMGPIWFKISAKGLTKVLKLKLFTAFSGLDHWATTLFCTASNMFFYIRLAVKYPHAVLNALQGFTSYVGRMPSCLPSPNDCQSTFGKVLAGFSRLALVTTVTLPLASLIAVTAYFSGAGFSSGDKIYGWGTNENSVAGVVVRKIYGWGVGAMSAGLIVNGCAFLLFLTGDGQKLVNKIQSFVLRVSAIIFDKQLKFGQEQAVKLAKKYCEDNSNYDPANASLVEPLAKRIEDAQLEVAQATTEQSDDIASPVVVAASCASFFNRGVDALRGTVEEFICPVLGMG